MHSPPGICAPASLWLPMARERVCVGEGNASNHPPVPPLCPPLHRARECAGGFRQILSAGQAPGHGVTPPPIPGEGAGGAQCANGPWEGARWRWSWGRGLSLCKPPPHPLSAATSLQGGGRVNGSCLRAPPPMGPQPPITPQLGGGAMLPPAGWARSGCSPWGGSVL